MAKLQRKKKGGLPKISTASLPDIIFMLLFFFMVSTKMREVNTMVQITVPKATEARKIENKSLVSYIYIGVPKEKFKSKYGTKPVIQLNDQIVDVDAVPQFVEQERAERPESDVPKMIFSLKVDENVEMGIVSDVKDQLRNVQALKINYSAKRAPKKQ